MNKRAFKIQSLVVGLSFLEPSSTFAQSLQATQAQAHVQNVQLWMMLLGSWACLNIVVGGILRSKAQGALRSFHEMNAGWNFVNLIIAFYGYLNLPTEPRWSLKELVGELDYLDGILLVNSGLDVAYLALGFALVERGLRLSSNRLRGFGSSIMLQGGFLLIFDILFFSSHHALSQAVHTLMFT